MKPTIRYALPLRCEVHNAPEVFILDVMLMDGTHASYVIHRDTPLTTIETPIFSESVTLSVRPLAKEPAWRRLVGRLVRA